ncbi:MAG: hypothetical protein H0V01_10205 [Bacteroidetes bacterium]|nr:hypothetical protein [Bacteroidota bacterium]HET6246033.1 hypothetical protein [Bacteroidia bacterium]
MANIIKPVKIIDFIFSVFLLSIFLVSCGGKETNDSQEQVEEIQQVDHSNSTLLTINGEIFSIPSPIQTALLIKELGSNYNKEMLNPPKGSEAYPTKFQKAINLGVYGADMGYVTIYDQTQDALLYLKYIKGIAEDLGVMGAFDKTLLERFEKNMGNQDSILILVSDAYRASDSYLKNQERNDIGVLILVGGFVESLHFAIQAAEQKNDPELIKRIGEQKSSLENVIKLLSPYYQKEEFKEITDLLIDLAEDFDAVEYVYIYEKPTTDVATKTTTINSRTEVKISDEQFKTIASSVKKLRSKIIS